MHWSEDEPNLMSHDTHWLEAVFVFLIVSGVLPFAVVLLLAYLGITF